MVEHRTDTYRASVLIEFTAHDIVAARTFLTDVLRSAKNKKDLRRDARVISTDVVEVKSR